MTQNGAKEQNQLAHSGTSSATVCVSVCVWGGGGFGARVIHISSTFRFYALKWRVYLCRTSISPHVCLCAVCGKTIILLMMP